MSYSLVKSPCHPLRLNHAWWWWHDRNRHPDRTQIAIQLSATLAASAQAKQHKPSQRALFSRLSNEDAP